MKGHSLWSFAPYRPPLFDVGTVYICRIAPVDTAVHFEWLPCGEPCRVYFRKRGEGEFIYADTVTSCEYTLEGLCEGVDYEFFVKSESKQSRVRLARTGSVPGTVVNYLHPDDEAYSFSGRYLCSPSLLRHPDGYLLASMDLFHGTSPQNLTLIYRSDDGGKSWRYVSELMPCFWGKMFLHRGELYMLACSTEYGDLLISKSLDGGKSFCTPSVLLRGSGGKNGCTGVHKNPQNMVYHNGRLYGTLEWGSWANKEYCHAAMVMSCDENDDIINPESWSFTEPRKLSHFAPELCDVPLPNMTIEGTLTITPAGELVNMMRFGKRGYALRYNVNTKDHEAPLEYRDIVKFPANFSKFMVKYDRVSGKYYSIVCRLYDGGRDSARNLQTLMASYDLENWQDVCILYDLRGEDVNKVGLQYVDFDFDGEDIIYLCRTAINGANSFHDSNYSTFHRIKNFRNL